MRRNLTTISLGIVLFSAAVFAEDPLRVGLYTDGGSRGGSVATWAELLDASSDVELTLMSGEDLRSGALTNIDLLVMPGGTGYGQYESMQEAGARAIRDFVRGGGRYFGTCAGIALLLNEENRVALLPFRRINGHYLRGQGDLNVTFNDAAAEKLGLASNNWTLAFSNGPILVPAKSVKGVTATVLATCANGIDAKPSFPKRKDDMIGTPAFIFAECGKGRIFACICHPESRAGTQELIRHGFAALVDRPIDFPELKPPHCIPCGKVRNLRDLGGWKGLDGKTVKMKKIYRAAGFNGNSQSNKTVDENGAATNVVEYGSSFIDDTNRNYLLKCLKLKTDIDLRHERECLGMTGSPIDKSVDWKLIPIMPYQLPKMNNGHPPALKKVFDIICDEERLPAVFHCSYGRDRSGTLAMLVLGVLGVSEEDIMSDYLASPASSAPTKFEHLTEEIKRDYPAPTFTETVEKYLLSIGVSPEQITAFRETMLQ